MQSVAAFNVDTHVNDYQTLNLLNLGDIQPLEGGSLLKVGEDVQQNENSQHTLDVTYVLPNGNLGQFEFTNDDNQFPQSESLDTKSYPVNCKCQSKVQNKLDYIQKKVFKELSSIREEVLRNRKILEEVLRFVRVESDGTSPIQDNGHTANTASEEWMNLLNETYKRDFPVVTADELINLSDKLKNDDKLGDFLFSKFEKIQANDAAKTVRKILKLLCDFNCLSEFSWLGTKVKKSFSKLEPIVDLIINVTERKFENLDGKEVLKAVIQQRTKSASEAVAKKKGQNSVVEQEDPPRSAIPHVLVED